MKQLRLNLIFFVTLERHAKIQKRRQSPSGRKVRGRKNERKMKEKKKKNNAEFSGYYVRPRMHAKLYSFQILKIS